MKKINYVVFIILSVFLIGFDLYKSSLASFTHDESFTYLTYMDRDVMDIISFHDSDVNNHILNTLLIKLFIKLFGTSELILRLPNILAHILYLVFTFKLFNRYSPKNFILFFILANANPFLIDFFSLARGYGLAIGLMSAGLYYYSRYLESARQRDHIYSLVFIGLASLANFSLLLVFAILLLVSNIFSFLIYRKKISFYSLWQVNRINFLVCVLFTVILYEPLRKIIRYKLVYDGGGEGLWEDTVRSLLYSSAYRAPYEDILTVFFKLFIVACFGLFIYRAIIYFMAGNSINMTQKLVLFFGLVLFGVAAASTLQNILLGTPYMKGRTALYIYPLFVFTSSFLLEELWNTRLKYPIRIFACFFSGLFFLHTGNVLSTNSYYEWQYDMNTKKAVTDLVQANVEHNVPVSLGVSWLFEPTVNFYKKIWNLDWLDETGREGFNLGNDYYYTVRDEVKNIPNDGAEIIQYYPETKSSLIRHNKWTVYLKAANGKFVYPDASHNNILLANGDSVSLAGRFTLLRSWGDSRYAIYSGGNKYVSAELAKHNEITANRNNVSSWEIFKMIKLDSNHVAFKAANGKFLSVDPNSLQLLANGDSIGRSQKFEMIEADKN